ncbi:MAG: 16S rRNA (guanine(966)-N(2))-methyltransferase RsmD [Dehalococcoidia bacterium]|nr:16S rRNA (guanine(966)-N(2))-methyltransferase RsmD [Dehalococcoidia bacterium]
MKEAMFAALGEAAGSGQVLDLYAGSGQLGIEALSRGASHIDFVDNGRLARRTIRRNLERTRFTAQGRIWRQRLPGALALLAKRGRGPYDLVLIDPPYEAPEVDSVLAELGTGTLLAKGAWVVVEHTKRRELEERYGELKRTGGRRHGDNVYAIFHRRPRDS